MNLTVTELVELCAKAMAENAGFAWKNCAQNQWRSDFRAAVAALEAAGMVVVPRLATDAMILAGARARPMATHMNTLTACGVWDCMVDAALRAYRGEKP